MSVQPSYLKHLGKDPKLKAILKGVEPIELHRRKSVCLRLCASIMGQQLSTQVAKVLWERFLLLYGGIEPKPQQILETQFETLRGIGLSNAKTDYIRNVAQHFTEAGLTDAKLYKMSNEAVYEALLPIKGVGRWTVQMLLMFTLAREDVFPVDDLGIQQAMIRMYGLDAGNKKLLKASMESIAEAWSPYRTYACLHLWQWKDDKA
jgi:DNA-3-methyladenine glycosylase II